MGSGCSLVFYRHRSHAVQSRHGKQTKTSDPERRLRYTLVCDRLVSAAHSWDPQTGSDRTLHNSRDQRLSVVSGPFEQLAVFKSSTNPSKLRLDHENRIEPLEPFQFNPTLDKSELKSEEIYTVKFLDKLGISKNCLIACNLPTANVTNNSNSQHQLAHYHSNLQLNVNGASSINTMMDNLISNKSTLNYLSSQAYNYQRSGASSMPAVQLTNEIKQSVNGTYRIIYHSVQKKLRTEWSSDENFDSFVSCEFRAMFGNGNETETWVIVYI